MTTILRQSTQIVVRVGPFMDATDGVTPETGITLGVADQAEALKAAGAATVDISGATWAAVTGASGWYDLTLTTSHTDTIGELVVVVQDASVCLPVFARFQIVEEAAYDAIYAASASPATTTGAVGLVTGAVGSVTGNVGGNVTGSVGSVLGGINTTGGTITTLDALDTAQDTQHAATITAIDAVPTAAEVWAAGTRTLTASSDPTAATIADAVWDEARSGHTTSGTYGESHSGIVSGTAATGTLSTTQMSSNLSEATNDHYIGRTIVWITGNLAGQASDVTDYAGSGGILTFTAVTEAPANGDRFVLV